VRDGVAAGALDKAQATRGRPGRAGGVGEIEARPPKVGAIFENAGRSLGEVAADIGVIVRAGARRNNKAGFAVARGLFNAEAPEDRFRNGQRPLSVSRGNGSSCPRLCENPGVQFARRKSFSI
jgi:hypothetical protein